jgi:hypothetical protein
VNIAIFLDRRLALHFGSINFCLQMFFSLFALEAETEAAAVRERLHDALHLSLARVIRRFI